MAINVRADIEAAQKKKKKIDVRADIATTAAPKVTTSKKDKSYTGVDAEINRREASRSARYSMQPEVRAAEIKRAEARGDTKRASELKKAKDVEKWADEQINSDFVKTRAQTVYDNEFNAAKLRGDQSPAVAAEHAAQGYLDMFRNKPQETRNETYAYRQAVRKNEYEGIDSRADYNERVIQGRAIIPQGKRDAGQSIIAYLNSPELRRQREERGEQFGDGSTILEHISVMTDAEKNRFRYLAATGDWEKVNDYYDLIKRDLNKRAQEETNKETYAESYNSPVKGTVKNVVAGFMTPGAYIATGANAIANKFRDDYIPVDTNSPMFAGAHMARETSSGVTERASDAVGGGTAGEIASLIAGTGLSMANFISKAPLGGVGSMVAMGLDSAGQTTLDVLERGGTEGQALLLGTAAGAIEAITEKLPLDNLFKIASEAGEKGLKATVKELLKQGAIEATEEMISELSNTILDVEVMRDKSEYQSYIATLMQNGMTREDAEKEAIFQIFGMNTLKAGAGGLLSGLAMGGGATAVSKVNSAIESRNAGAAEGEAGFTKNEFSKKVSNKTIRALDAIGKKLGTNISIGAPTGTGQGSFNGYYENGRIVISQDADDPLKVVLSHEVTHRMKETAPEAYAKFLEIAVNASEQLGGKQKSELLEEYKTWYSDYTQTDFKYEDALDEITADFAGRLADDLSLFKKLVDTDRNVAQRFIDGVREFISKVKSTFSKDKSKADTASLEKYGLKVSELEEAVKQWSAMVKATETAVKSGNAGIENTAETEQGGVVYDLKKDLLVDLKNLLVRKNKNSEELLIGTTSDFLVNKLGANPLQVTMPKNKAYAAMVTEAEAKNSGRYDSRLNYHGLGADLLYEALEASENPVVAFVDESNENEDRSDRIVLVTDKKKDENNIVVIMQVDADGTVDKKRVKANKDITVFDRKSLSADISKAIENNRLLYFDKKRSQTISAGDKAANSPSAIQKVDFKDNIARFWANVNWKKSGNKSVFEASAMNVGTPFEEAYNKALKKSNSQFSLKKNTDNLGRELSAEQAEYFKDSKVRDKDGNLLVMYHQTEGDFTVFDPRKEGAGTSDEQTPFGIFMKTSDADIGLRGKKQMPLYANITNPLYAETREDLARKLRDLSPEYAKIESESRDIDRTYKEKTDNAAKNIELYLIEWRKNNPEASRRAIYEDPKFNEISDIEDALLEEWEQKSKENSVRAKNIITEALRTARYDGVVLLSDAGSWGRKTDTYIALSPEQVKNVDNKKPTENPDIRYSLKGKKPIEPDAERKAERERMRELESENAKQKKLIEQLKDRMKDMSPNRIAGQVDEKAVKKAAREIVQRYSTTVKASELAPKLKKLWDRMGTGKNLSWEEVSAEAKAIATEIAKSAVEKDDTLYQEFAELRKFARETTFTISESDRSNIPDFADFRKQNMGRMNIANGKTNIDTVYKELGEMYPGLFDEEKISNPADQLLHIAEVLNDVYDITESNPFEGHMDYAVNSIANDILETFYDIPENKKTFQEMKIQRLERTVLERDAQVKETQRILNQYHKSVEKLLSDYNQKQKEVKEKKIALDEERARFYEKQDERKKRAQIIRATNRLSQKLRWATDKKHIPQELQGAVARFLEYVNLTGLYTYDEKGKLQKSDDGTPTQKSLTYRQLRTIYEQYDGEFTFAPEFLEGVFEDGEQRGDILGQIYDLRDTRVAEMNKEQLDVVLKGVKIVETAIKNADRMFSDSRFKEISSLAENIKENAPIKDKFKANRLTSWMKQFFDIDNLTPEAFFHRLGAGGDAIFNLLSEAEAKRTRITKEVGEFTEKLLDNKKRQKLEKEVVEVTLGGEQVEMSVAQIMELYALSRRKQAEKHILEGGIIIEGIPGKKREIRRTAIKASVREIGEAINKLTPEQRKLAERLSKFASDKLGGYMNEACRKVFGYEKFGEINYWPIRIDDRTIRKKADTADASKATPTIRNFGMAKATTHGANNALKVGSIFDTFASHAAESSTYAAYLEAMEDMRRVINFTYGDGEGMQHVLDGVFGISMQKSKGEVIEKHPGIEYWNKLYEDINGGMKPKDGGSPFDPFFRNAKLSQVAANMRVVIQQPTAYLRAGSEIDPKYLSEGVLHAKRGWERALKYAPIAQQKEWGRADIGTGQTMKEILFGSDGVISDIQEWSMWLAGKADATAWGSLWSACEAEVRNKHKKIKPDSTAFYETVAKRFTEIINKTQVVDGVLQRSQNMRKQNALVKLGTMFMSEPTKQYNMIASAVYDLAHSEGKEKKAEAKKKLARTATSLVIATVINAAAQSIVDAMRDDDDEKKYWEKWLSAFLGLPDKGSEGADAARSIVGGNLIEGLNPIGYFPFAKDAWSIVQGFDVKRTDVEGLAAFVRAAVSALQAFSGESKQSIASSVNNAIAAGATLFGVPYASFKRDIGAFAKSIIQGIGNPVLDYRVEKLTKNIKNEKNAADFIDILYKAKQKDKEAYDIIYRDMVKNGYKKEDIDKKITTYTSGKFDRALSSARKAKESEDATETDKVIYRHLNREKNMTRDVRAGDEDTVLDNLDKYRANVEKYLKEYPGKDEEKAIDYAYRKANYATYGAEYAIRASGGKSVYDKALEKVNRGKTTWKEYYDEYFGKDERRYEKLRDKYNISYAEYEKIAEAMSKNNTEEEEIEALHKLGYKRSTARGIRRNFNKVK